MTDDGNTTPEDFDRLLRWLDQEHTRAGAEYDPERAGARYEKIRRRLIIICASRGCHVPEDVTDEVFRRVTRKVCKSNLDENWDGNDPVSYFLGVLAYVLKEPWWRRPPPAPPSTSSGEDGARYECFEACLLGLPREERDLILRFRQGTGREGIEQRRRLAEDLGISRNALGIRVHRVLEKLRGCVRQCLKERGES